MAQRMAGIAYIKADGSQFSVTGGIEAPLSLFKREPAMGLAGPIGYKEVAQEPYIKFDAGFTVDFDISTMTTNTNMTVTAEFANGKVYTLTGAYLAGDGNNANGEEGTVGLYFSGLNGVWQ